MPYISRVSLIMVSWQKVASYYRQINYSEMGPHKLLIWQLEAFKLIVRPPDVKKKHFYLLRILK